MSIADLSNILHIFGGKELDPEQEQQLFKEALLMTLARAASSDSNVQSVEITSIQEIVQRETGIELSEQDVRKAARTELYESTPIKKYLTSVGHKLTDPDRVAIVHLLAEVIKSDTSVSVLELDYFNMVAEALKASPAELAGLTSD
jgi:uncharacterized tellurite resistance protein B-like protein